MAQAARSAAAPSKAEVAPPKAGTPTLVTPPVEAPRPRGRKKLVFLFVLCCVLAIAGTGGYVARQRARRAATVARAAGVGHTTQEAVSPRVHRGPLVPLESIITNILDVEELHFLKVTVQLEARDEAAKADVEEALVPIRDKVLLRLSSLTLADTQGAEKKLVLQAELLTMINTELQARRVVHVYFTEFVVQ